MTAHPFIDDADAMRFEQAFETQANGTCLVFCDYGVEGRTRVLLHVEADPLLRGTGASGRFMQALADYARAHDLRVVPRCSYAVVWFQRHPDQQDLLA
jgi:predicted GNAT family acetyltransferase